MGLTSLDFSHLVTQVRVLPHSKHHLPTIHNGCLVYLLMGEKATMYFDSHFLNENVPQICL